MPTDEELALADELLGAAAGAGESVRSLLSMDAGFEAVRSDGVGADGAARSAARSLLALSVSGGNTRWVGWENLPQRLDEPRSGPEVRQGRQSGHTHVTLAGGYWEAALINSVVQPANRVRSRRGAGDALGLASSGEGTLSGPYAGINQHDRLGLDKASGALSTAALHRDARCAFSHCRDDLQISLDAYPSLGSVDRVHLKIQPFVVGVTSYCLTAARTTISTATSSRLICGAIERRCDRHHGWYALTRGGRPREDRERPWFRQTLN